jgi:hypothetical protein
VQEYLRFIEREARRRYDAGMAFEEAARDIALGEFRHWTAFERIVVTVYSLDQEYSGERTAPNHAQLFDSMAAYRERSAYQRRPRPADLPGQRAWQLALNQTAATGSKCANEALRHPSQSPWRWPRSAAHCP